MLCSFSREETAQPSGSTKTIENKTLLYYTTLPYCIILCYNGWTRRVVLSTSISFCFTSTSLCRPSTFFSNRICWLSAFIKFCLYNSSLALFSIVRDSTCSLNLAMSSASVLFRLRALKQFKRTFVSSIETKSKRGIHRYSHLRRNWMDCTIHYSRSFIRIVGCHYDKEWIRMNERIYEELLLETKLVYLVWNLCLKSLFEILTPFALDSNQEELTWIRAHIHIQTCNLLSDIWL